MRNIKRFFVLIILLICLFEGSYVFLRQDSISSLSIISIAVVLVIFPSAAMYLLLIRQRALSKKFLYLSLLGSTGACYVIFPANQKGVFQQVLNWMIPMLEAGLLLILLFSIIKTVQLQKERVKSENEDLLEILKKSLQVNVGNELITEVMLTELRVFYYSIWGWFIKPSDTEDSKSYYYHKMSQLKMIVIVFSILIVLEGMLFHFLIQRWSEVAAWIFTILNIYALLYIVALYRSVKLLPHTMIKDKLLIRFGFQSSIEMEFRNIETIQPMREQSIYGDRKSKKTYHALLNIDAPQYEILLKEPAFMIGTYGKKKLVEKVVFRTDEPLKMEEDIKRKIIQFNNPESEKG